MKTKAAEPIKTTQVDGDVSIGRNVAMGGDHTVQGDSLLKGDVTVEGWLIAANVVSTYKGYFKDEYSLNSKFEHPQDGWWSFVGKTLYVVHNGEWTIATGTFTEGAIEDVKKIFLSKINPDTAYGLITFLQGIEIGIHGFTDGITGQGAKIDKYGNGWMEGLHLRSFLEVPELRYNRATVLIGDSWSGAGGGIVESVEADVGIDGNPLPSGTVTLKLEDGDIGAVAEDDICMGYYHDVRGGNATQDSDDSRGNRTFAGFSTVYFRVTEILEEGTRKRFRYAIRGVSERWKAQNHPYEGMHFVAYGNFSDKERQKSRYETRTYARYLSGVNDWEFTPSMIMMQAGDLSNLNVHGLQMDGYSAYLNNIYMSGTIEQMVQLPVRLEIDTEGDDVLAYGEHLHVTCKAMRGWEDLTDKVAEWKITRDSGAAAEDAAWALRQKVKDFSGTIDIHLDKDVEIDDLGSSEISTLFTISARLGEINISKSLII